MRPDDLQSYIARFREWLDGHAAPVLQTDHSAVVTTWREELAAAERLLEQKPELPIAFIGPSQQGKSSLINAIVGETILAVGGAVGACTCVITSVHHHPADNFRAEIDFISFKDWAGELAAIRHAATADPADDDTDFDREEREANKKSALEKFSAVYRGESVERLPNILGDANLALPKDIVFAMSQGGPLIITEDKAISLRNKVRRYLVGREQHEEGQFWPLISRVRIYGNFEALSNGVVLVDLPGLNDPNLAREEVTKKYLEDARYLWLVCNSQTGIDRVFTQVLRENEFLFRLFLEGRIGVFSVIATRIDDMNVDAVLTQMGRDADDFDGNYGPLLQFRRTEIAAHVQRNLIAIAEDRGYRFRVKTGKPADVGAVKNGTKLTRGAHFRCLMSGTPIESDYIKAEGIAGRMGTRLIAAVVAAERGRIYISPSEDDERIAAAAQPRWTPDQQIAYDPHSGATYCVLYGLTGFRDLFTRRQLTALTTFSDLVLEVRERVRKDHLSVQCLDDSHLQNDADAQALRYADSIVMYVSFAISRLADFNSSICTWKPSGEQVMHTFTRQSIPMTWDFAESNSLAETAVCWSNCVKYTADNLIAATGHKSEKGGSVSQEDASIQTRSRDCIVSTDRPYYDNVPYADLSDFFYVWLRHSLRTVFPDLFATLAVPRAEELVATPSRHGGSEQAEAFFLEGMTRAMHRLAEQAHPGFPITIYYAFKQSERDHVGGIASTGWDTFLDAVIRAGFSISGTWPIRTEMLNKVSGIIGRNMLASSIIVVCRSKAPDLLTVTRREFVTALKAELPVAVGYLQHGNIAPVDLAQAAIGPGMAVYTRYAKVVDAAGKTLSVREALALINQTLDEVLAEQEGDFDADTRWAVAWTEQHGFAEGEYGVAETLSKAKNTSIGGMVEAGILSSKRGKVRLLKPDELPDDWDPATNPRLTAWEMVHQLIRALEAGGESVAASLVAKLGSKAEIGRELAYRLYTIAERMKRAAEALSYNGLVQSWPEITRLARAEPAIAEPAQAALL